MTKRNLQTRHVRDWIDGTRALSDAAYRRYDELILLIVEAGGRLRFRGLGSEDEDTICRRLSIRDRRTFRRPFLELTAGEGGKLVAHEGWLYNGRVLRGAGLLGAALAEWGLPDQVLVRLGFDAGDLARARAELERPARAAVDETPAAVDQTGDMFEAAAGDPAGRGDNRPTVGRQSADSRPYLDPSFEENQRVADSPRRLTSYFSQHRERSSPVPREASWGQAALRLGKAGGGGRGASGADGGADRARDGPRLGRLRRPEQAHAALIRALVEGEALAASEALALIELAEDPRRARHAEAARRCARVSARHRCGWWPPAGSA